MPSDTGPDDGASRTAGDVRSRITKKLPSVRVGFPKHLDALRAYGILAGAAPVPVRYQKVAELIQVHESNVSSLNPFFMENGFLEKSGNGVLPAPAVIEYTQAHKWNEATAAQKLAPLLYRSWFGAIITRKLQFRSLSEDSAIETLASECGAAPESRPALRMLLDYLEAAAIIRRDGGMLYANHLEPTQQPPPPLIPTVEPVPMSIAPGAPSSVTVEQAPSSSPMGGIRFQVSVNISMEEMGGWPADRITALFAGVAQVMNAQKG